MKLIINTSVIRNGKILTVSRKKAKILATHRKSHYPIKTLYLGPEHHHNIIHMRLGKSRFSFGIRIKNLGMLNSYGILLAQFKAIGLKIHK